MIFQERRGNSVLYLLLVLGLLSACSSSTEPEPDPGPSLSLTPLRDATSVPIGLAFQARRLQLTAYSQIARQVFSSITAEYEMKMAHISMGPGAYDWSNADDLVNFALAHEMQVHGHALVWHESTPPWLEQFSGTDEAFEAAVRQYIMDVVGRYKDRVVSWDVVNEAFENNTGLLRRSVFRQKMGEDYLARLFQYAREADPDALLFYNDYATPWDDAKQDAMLAMVDDFQRRGIPIDGVGLQMHVTYNFPPIDRITAVMDSVVSRGLLVHISEMDVRVNPDGDLTQLTPARSQAQKDRLKAIVNAFMELPADQRFAITVWGLRDPDSWLIDFWGNPEWPLLYDEGFAPKPAYEGFLEAPDGWIILDNMGGELGDHVDHGMGIQ